MCPANAVLGVRYSRENKTQAWSLTQEFIVWDGQEKKRGQHILV